MKSDELKRIPMLDLKGEVEELWPELSEAVLRVLRSGQYVLGPEVEAFEAEAAAYLGVKHAVGLNSGTDALVIGLRALGIGPGDEVITTAFSFFATAEAILHVGATPVFVDIEEESFNIDPTLIEAAITEKTKAILPVHLYGRPAQMDQIMQVAQKHGLKVLEDCAQSFGARFHSGDASTSHLDGRMTGSIGHVGAFSFYPTKNLGAYGDGGLLATNDDDVARLARMLRNHGASPERRYEHEMVGYNSRLDEFQAAVLRVKLPHVDRFNQLRRTAAATYTQELAHLESIRLPVDAPGHVYHQYSVLVNQLPRDAVVGGLAAAGIATSTFYPRTLSTLFNELGRQSHARNSAPVAEAVAGRVISLPIGAGISQEHIERVRGALEHISD
mgnify:CR=1 FL=1